MTKSIRSSASLKAEENLLKYMEKFDLITRETVIRLLNKLLTEIRLDVLRTVEHIYYNK